MKLHDLPGQARQAGTIVSTSTCSCHVKGAWRER